MSLKQNSWTRPHCTCINITTGGKKKKQHNLFSTCESLFQIIVCNNRSHGDNPSTWTKSFRSSCNYIPSYFIGDHWECHISFTALSHYCTGALKKTLLKEEKIERRFDFTRRSTIKRTEPVKATRCRWNIIQDPTCSTRHSKTDRGQIQEIKMLSLSIALSGLSGFLRCNNLTKCLFAE